MLLLGLPYSGPQNKTMVSNSYISQTEQLPLYKFLSGLSFCQLLKICPGAEPDPALKAYGGRKTLVSPLWLGLFRTGWGIFFTPVASISY